MKQFLTKKNIYIIGAIIIVGIIFANKTSHDSETIKEKDEVKLVKNVETLVLTNSANDVSPIEVVGEVKASTQIDVVSLAQGTLKSINFKVGDKVWVNKILANLYNSATLVNLSNAQVNYNNVQNNLSATEKINEENINRAEISVQSAEEAIKTAEISLKTAQDNLENSTSIQVKSNQDTKQNAITSFGDYINSIDNALTQANYIIHADEEKPQLAGIDETLGAKNTQGLVNTKVAYHQVIASFNNLKNITPIEDSIISDIKSAVTVLNQSKKVVDGTIDVLDNTVTSVNFGDTDLNTQKTTFNTLASTLISSISGAKSTLQTLENLSLNNKQEIDALENAVSTYENQLSIAKIAYDTAVSALANAKQSKEQSIVGAQTSLDGSKGQLNLAQVQTGDLNIKAPIKGQITKKYVELGAEVQPGTKIAQISQSEKLKIEINLNSEDIYKIKADKNDVLLNDKYSGEISHIDPVADPVTKKVKVEILFDNKDDILIPGTFAKVKITPQNNFSDTEESVAQNGLDNEPQFFLVPLKAVIIDQNENYIFVDKEGIATKINVITSDIKGESIVVTGKLKAGDSLIVSGNRDLKEGDSLLIKN